MALVICWSIKLRLLRSPHIMSETMTREVKQRKSRGLHRLCLHAHLSRCGSFRIVSILRQFRATSTCSFAGLVSSSSFNHSSWLQCDLRSLRAKNRVRHWTYGFHHQIFASSASSRTKMGKKLSCVFVIKKIWQERKLNYNLRWNNQIENSSHAQMKWHLSQSSRFFAFFVKRTVVHLSGLNL